MEIQLAIELIVAARFVAHLYKHRPTLVKALAGDFGEPVGGENRLSTGMYCQVPRSDFRSLRWWPPMFPQRAFPVYRCGWKGLHTARAVAKISATTLTYHRFGSELPERVGGSARFRVHEFAAIDS